MMKEASCLNVAFVFFLPTGFFLGVLGRPKFPNHMRKIFEYIQRK